MQNHNGSVPHRPLMANPALTDIRKYYAPTRGIIESVYHKDHSKTKQTTAQVWLLYYQTRIYNVPLLTSRMTKTKAGDWHGEDWTPEVGNMVLVHFVDGNQSDPVVSECFNSPDNPIQATSAEAPHYKKRMNNTSETIDKEGNRIIDVAKNETVTIKGNGTVTIAEGDLTIEVTTGKATISVKGNADITVEGTTTVTSPTVDVTASTKVKMTTPLLQVTGNITAANVTAATNVFDQNGTKSMAGMRTTFNSHTHPENGTGAGTTSAPTAQQ